MKNKLLLLILENHDVLKYLFLKNCVDITFQIKMGFSALLHKS